MPSVPADSSAPVAPQATLDRHGYLFGLKIQASMSPLLHKTIYDGIGLKWEQLRLESSDIPQFLELIRDPKAYGSCPPTAGHPEPALLTPQSQEPR